jgi:zinc/manganese transport system substrate-binding protein
MEPKPGLTPTTRHLRDLVGTMQSRDVRFVISSVYFDDRYAAFLGRNTEAKVIELAHQVGARPEAEGYLAMFEHNVEQLREATGVD